MSILLLPSKFLEYSCKIKTTHSKNFKNSFWQQKMKDSRYVQIIEMGKEGKKQTQLNIGLWKRSYLAAAKSAFVQMAPLKAATS